MGRFTRSLASLVLSGLGWMSPQLIAAGSAAAQPGLPQRQAVNTAAGPLSSTLRTLSTQFGENLVAADALLRGERSPAVSGMLTFQEALGAALAGAALKAQRQGSGAYVLVRAATQAPTNPGARRDADAELEEIVVLGARESGYVSATQSGGAFGEQSIFDTPFSVTSIPQEVLLDQQVRALGDIAGNDPSTIVSAPPGFNDTVNIRGYNLDNSSSYRRESLIYQNQAQNSFENKAAVEIIKGPTSVRYGFTPPGGVVNYVLKRPTRETYRWAQGFSDSNGSYGAHLDMGGQLNDEIGVRFNGVLAREAAFVDEVAGARQLFSVFFDYQASDKLSFEFEGEYSFRELEQQASIRLASFARSLSSEQISALLDRFKADTFIGQRWGTYPTTTFIGSGGVNYAISDNWQLYARVQKMRSIRDQQAAGIVSGSIQANGDFEQNVYFDPSQVRDPLSLETFVTGNVDTGPLRHEATFGVAYSKNPLRFSLGGDYVVSAGMSNIFNPVALPRPAPTSTQTVDALYFIQRSAFASDLIAITDKLRILATLRWSEQENRDRFNAAQTLETTYKDSALVPNIGVMLDPIENLTLYASFSEGITAGVQIPADAANFGLDNEVFLDPAQTAQFEIGFKAKVFDRAILTGAYFDISQPLATFDPNNVFGYIGDQDHRGFEIALSGDLTDRLRLITGAIALNATINNPNDAGINGNRPAGVPEFQFSAYVDYEPSFMRGLALNLGIFHTGERLADNQNTFAIDAFTRIDLGGRYAFRLGDQALTARLNVRNVTDEAFIEGTAFGSFFFGSPRAAFVSIATEF